MGIVAYYVHVDESQLAALREQPAIVWNIGSDPRFAKAALMDVDKDWEVLSWLASAKKRKEQEQYAATMNVVTRPGHEKLPIDKKVFEEAVGRERRKLGVGSDDGKAMPMDPLLEGIEGRGTQTQRDPQLNFGLGYGRVFQPAEVKRIAVAFSNVKVTDLRARFDRKTMARFDVGGMGWLQEPDSVFGDFLWPAFHRLSGFYREAAQADHHVIVFYQ